MDTGGVPDLFQLQIQAFHTVRHRVQVGHGAHRRVAAPGGGPASRGDGLLIRKSRLSEMHMHITKTGKNHISGRIQRRKRGTGDGSTDTFRELGHQGRSKTFGLDHRSHKCLLSYSLAAIRLKKCPAEGGKTVVAASRCIYLGNYSMGSTRLSSDKLVQIPLNSGNHFYKLSGFGRKMENISALLRRAGS